MPSQYIRRRGNNTRELGGWIQLLIINETANEFSTAFVIVEFNERELGRSQGSTDELKDATFILRSHKENSVRVMDDSILSFVF